MSLAALATQQPPGGPTVTIPAAAVGGGQANAILMPGANNIIAAVATAADSVRLPPTFGGDAVVVVNKAAVAMQVFGTGTDTINGVAFGTGVSQAAGLAALYVSIQPGLWARFLQA